VHIFSVVGGAVLLQEPAVLLQRAAAAVIYRTIGHAMEWKHGMQPALVHFEFFFYSHTHDRTLSQTEEYFAWHLSSF